MTTTMDAEAERWDEELELSRIRERIDAIDAERRRLSARRQEIEDARARQKFVCACVRLNKDIDIHGMAEQEVLGRYGLQLGLVSETLSALKACPSCRGSGIPKEG